MAVFLMVVGIALIGVFTATVSSFFFEQQRQQELAQIDKRLAAIEENLGRLLKERQ